MQLAADRKDDIAAASFGDGSLALGLMAWQPLCLQAQKKIKQLTDQAEKRAAAASTEDNHAAGARPA